MAIVLTPDTLNAVPFGFGTNGGSLLSNDTIDPATYSFTVEGVDVLPGNVTVHGDYGSLIFDGAGQYRYQAHGWMANDIRLLVGETLTDTFSYTVAGDGDTDTATLTVSLTAGGLALNINSTSASDLGTHIDTDYLDSGGNIIANAQDFVSGNDTFVRDDNAVGEYDFQTWTQVFDDNGDFVSESITLDNGDTVTVTHDYAQTEDYHTRYVYNNGSDYLTEEFLFGGLRREITEHSGLSYVTRTILYNFDDSVISRTFEDATGETREYLTVSPSRFEVTQTMGTGTARERLREAIVENGNLISEDITFTNGTTIEKSFHSNSALSSRIVNDHGDMRDYQHLNVSFDDAGQRQQLLVTYDNGDTLVSQFTEGVLTSRTRRDESDTKSWVEHFESYDENGNVERLSITFDDGVRLQTYLINGNREFVRTDNDDAHDWSSRSLVYNADGNRVGQTHVDDNGNSERRAWHDNGQLAERMVHDGADEFDWMSHTTNYDEAGNRIARSWTYDDFTSEGTTWDSEGRVDSRSVSRSTENGFFSRTNHFDDFGNRIERVIVEGGFDGPPTRTVYTYDTDGNLLSETSEALGF